MAIGSPGTYAVVGAGIAGLAAAHRIVELAPGCRLTVFEADGRTGGVLSTVHEEGYQVERSADNFITTVPWGVALCRRLNLADELIPTNPEFRRTYVVHRGRLHKLPDGFLMMAPTRLWPLALTPILTPLGKLRAALEYFLPPQADRGDESMAAFVRRRLGREVFERLVEPLVSSVYAADMEKLSLEATLSQFRDMERKYGSLIRAMRARAAAQRGATDTGARYSMFVTPRGGLSSIVRALVARLPEGALRLNTPVERMQRQPDGRWLLTAGGASAVFDGVVLATPSYVAGRLLAEVESELAAALSSVKHSGTAILSVGFDRRQVGHPLDAMGAVVPARAKSPILACSFSSQKYAHRAPEGKVLLRVFAGGARRPELVEMPDGELEPLLLGELGRLLRIDGPPVYRNIARWPNTMPQYYVGHRHLVERIESHVGKLPNFGLAGNAFHGVGIPHCIHSGETAAERVLGKVLRGSSASHPTTA